MYLRLPVVGLSLLLIGQAGWAAPVPSSAARAHNASKNAHKPAVKSPPKPGSKTATSVKPAVRPSATASVGRIEEVRDIKDPAVNAWVSKEYSKSIALFSQEISGQKQSNIEKGFLYYGRGSSKARSGTVASAKDDFTEAITRLDVPDDKIAALNRTAPNRAKILLAALIGRSNCNYEAEHWLDAVEDQKKIVKLIPSGDPDGGEHLRVGLLYFCMRDYKNTIDWCDQALKINPNNKSAAQVKEWAEKAPEYPPETSEKLNEKTVDMFHSLVKACKKTL